MNENEIKRVSKLQIREALKTGFEKDPNKRVLGVLDSDSFMDPDTMTEVIKKLESQKDAGEGFLKEFFHHVLLLAAYPGEVLKIYGTDEGMIAVIEDEEEPHTEREHLVYHYKLSKIDNLFRNTASLAPADKKKLFRQALIESAKNQKMPADFIYYLESFIDKDALFYKVLIECQTESKIDYSQAIINSALETERQFLLNTIYPDETICFRDNKLLLLKPSGIIKVQCNYDYL